jgi:hypothetical protein
MARQGACTVCQGPIPRAAHAGQCSCFVYLRVRGREFKFCLRLSRYEGAAAGALAPRASSYSTGCSDLVHRRRHSCPLRAALQAAIDFKVQPSAAPGQQIACTDDSTGKKSGLGHIGCRECDLVFCVRREGWIGAWQGLKGVSERKCQLTRAPPIPLQVSPNHLLPELPVQGKHWQYSGCLDVAALCPSAALGSDSATQIESCWRSMRMTV